MPKKQILFTYKGKAVTYALPGGKISKNIVESDVGAKVDSCK